MDTLIIEDRVMFNPVNPPAITVVAWTTELMKGSKDVPKDGSELKDFCKTSASYLDFVQCVNNKTFYISNMLETAKVGIDGQRT